MPSESLVEVFRRAVASTFPHLSEPQREALALEHAVALETLPARRFAHRLGRDGVSAVLAVEGNFPARGWLTAWTRTPDAVAEALLRDLEAELKTWGPGFKLRVGGPPGGYLVSGVDAADAGTLAWFATLGFSEERRHVDLRVDLAPPVPLDARLRRADRSEGPGLVEWLAAEAFAPAWQREVSRALDRDAVFVAGEPGSYRGFGAHSGNSAVLGWFGPVGVAERVRREGLGAALTDAALSDLFARGHREATIPWVEHGLIEFYRRRVAKLDVVERVVLVRERA